MEFTNYYDIIKGNRNMNRDELKQALKYNIEREGVNDEDKNIMQTAFEFLSDIKRRRIYDLLGRFGYYEIILKSRTFYAGYMLAPMKLKIFFVCFLMFILGTFLTPVVYGTESSENTFLLYTVPTLFVVSIFILLLTIKIAHGETKHYLPENDEERCNKLLKKGVRAYLYFIYFYLNLLFETGFQDNVIIIALILALEFSDFLEYWYTQHKEENFIMKFLRVFTYIRNTLRIFLLTAVLYCNEYRDNGTKMVIILLISVICLILKNINVIYILICSAICINISSMSALFYMFKYEDCDNELSMFIGMNLFLICIFVSLGSVWMYKNAVKCKYRYYDRESRFYDLCYK